MNFADDKQIAVPIGNIGDTNVLQSAIEKFMEWCRTNKLVLNKSKCKIITFTHKRNPIQQDYFMDLHQVDRVSELRCLGVKMDSKLNFNSHMEYAINKSKASLSFVGRQSQFLDQDVVKILYSALVRSTIEFACSIWSPKHKTHKTSIESIQKQLLIFMNGDHINRSNNNYVLRPYDERCVDAALQTLVRRRANSSAMFIHGLISGKTNAPNLRNRINVNSGVRTIRNPEFIRVQFSKTDSPFNNACYTYNHAALFIDPTLSMREFKRQLENLPDCAFGPWANLQL